MAVIGTYIESKPFLRAFIEAANDRLAAIQLEPLCMYLVDTAPAPALFYIADILNVRGTKGYRYLTTDADKRTFLKNAVRLWRKAGTVDGIKTALDLIGYGGVDIQESLGLTVFYDGSVNYSGGEQYGFGTHWAYFRLLYNLANFPSGIPPADQVAIIEITNAWKNVRSVLLEVAAQLNISDNLPPLDELGINAAVSLSDSLAAFYDGGVSYSGSTLYRGLDDNVTIDITLTPQAQWAQDTLSSYLFQNKFVDGSGVDIINRTVSASDKNDIFRILRDNVYTDTDLAGVTYGSRAPSDMAKAMKHWRFNATTFSGSFNLTATESVQWWMNNTSYLSQSWPAHVEGSPFVGIMISRRATGSEWTEILYWRFRASGGNFNDTLLPSITAPNATEVDFRNARMTGDIGDILPSVPVLGTVNLPNSINIGNTNTGFFDVNALASRLWNGGQFEGASYTQSALEGLIDVLVSPSVLPNLNPGVTLDLRNNPGSAGVSVSRAAEIMTLMLTAGWTVLT